MVQELLMGQRKSQPSDLFPLEARMKNVTCKEGFNQSINYAISANMEKYGANRIWEI